MNTKEVREICEKYLDIRRNTPFGYGYDVTEIINSCNKLEAMGWEYGHKLNYADFRIRKGYYITNNGTGHKSNKDEWYVEWDNRNIGRLQFVSQEYWGYVSDEWDEFKRTLMSYNPVNYDPLNCHIIYDVENGKKILEDYPDICKKTSEAMEKKLKQVKVEKAKAELERLIKEQNDEID